MKIKNAEVSSKHAEACPQAAVGVLPSAFCLQPARRGIALVITLILLSVTLIMAVAFLAVVGAVCKVAETGVALSVCAPRRLGPGFKATGSRGRIAAARRWGDPLVKL